MKPAALLALLLLSACQKAEIRALNEASQQAAFASATMASIYRDPDTGCEYIGFGSGTLSARIDSNGISHRGCKTPLLEKAE